MEQGILGIYSGVDITEEDLDLLEKAVRFFVEASGYYISYDEGIELQQRAKKTLRKFGILL